MAASPFSFVGPAWAPSTRQWFPRRDVAAMVAAYDIETGAVAVGRSGNIPKTLPPALQKLADALGGLGARNRGCAPVGNCAELDAARQLVERGSDLANIGFVRAVRPSTGDPLPACANCRTMFGLE